MSSIKNLQKESLHNSVRGSKKEVWLKNKQGMKSCVPEYIALQLLKDKNRGYEITEPDFVPKERVEPFDNKKNEDARKMATTKLTGRQLNKRLNMTIPQLKELAKKNEVDLKGAKTKKDILEALEESGKLFE